MSEISGAIGSFPLDGDVTSTALMVNGYYDFRMISPSIIPYIGAGIGGVNVSADITDPDPVEGGKVLDDSEIVFGYQFIAGVAFPVTKQLTIDLNYRYFATTNPELEISDSGGVTAEVEAMGSNVFLGLRYSF